MSVRKNRLDKRHCAFYGYDGNGERTYKLTGTTSIDQYNAGEETFHMNFNDAVIYVNPYFTITPRNYTSHIMNGSQRIATRIETNGLTNCIDTTNAGAERIANARAYMQTLFAQGIELRPDTTATFVTNAGNSYDELQWQCVEDDLAWDITMQCDSDLLLTTSHSDSIFIDTVSSGIYYYYTDHLGSASWITEGEEPVQYIHYMPYGELWRNQRNTTYDERYKFTGKERDAETGYDFFGARSYSSAITSWLSVDPWADKYPEISPYSYCIWNPTTNLDPNGCGDPLTLMKVRRMMINHTFGMVRHSTNGSPKPHQGIDYYAPEGTDVMAVKNGTIVGCDFEGKGDYGKTITLQFEDENGKKAWAFYSHLSEIGVNVNDQVKEGDILGKTGISGNANNLKGEDQHLHFEYRTGGARLGKGLYGRDDPNLIVDTKFEPDPNNKRKVRYKED